MLSQLAVWTFLYHSKWIGSTEKAFHHFAFSKFMSKMNNLWIFSVNSNPPPPPISRSSELVSDWLKFTRAWVETLRRLLFRISIVVCVCVGGRGGRLNQWGGGEGGRRWEVKSVGGGRGEVKSVGGGVKWGGGLNRWGDIFMVFNQIILFWIFFTALVIV